MRTDSDAPSRSPSRIDHPEHAPMKPLSLTRALVCLALVSSAPSFAQGTTFKNQFLLWDLAPNLDVEEVEEFTRVSLDKVVYKDSRGRTRSNPLYRVAGLNLAATPAAVFQARGAIGKHRTTALAARQKDFENAAATLSSAASKTTDPHAKMLTAIAQGELFLAWAGSSEGKDRTARADAGLAALAPVLADPGTFFFIQASEVAARLHLAKESGDDAIAAAQALVSAADALGEEGVMLRAESRILLAQASLGAGTGGRARDAAKEAEERCREATKFFEERREAWGRNLAHRMGILERRAMILQGMGIVAQSGGTAGRTYFARLAGDSKMPGIPDAQTQSNLVESGAMRRVVTPEHYANHYWPGSEYWTGVQLGLAECAYRDAESKKDAKLFEEALTNYWRVVAIAPEMGDLLGFAKLRVGECILAVDSKNTKLANSYFQDVIVQHGASPWATLARARMGK